MKTTQKINIRTEGYFTQNYSVSSKGSTNGLELESTTKIYFYGRLMVRPTIETIDEMLTKLKAKFPSIVYRDDNDGDIRVSIKHRRERITIRYDKDAVPGEYHESEEDMQRMKDGDNARDSS